MALVIHWNLTLPLFNTKKGTEQGFGPATNPSAICSIVFDKDLILDLLDSFIRSIVGSTAIEKDIRGWFTNELRPLLVPTKKQPNVSNAARVSQLVQMGEEGARKGQLALADEELEKHDACNLLNWETFLVEIGVLLHPLLNMHRLSNLIEFINYVFPVGPL